MDIAEGNVRKEFTDNSAAFHERSYLLPTKRSDAIKVCRGQVKFIIMGAFDLIS